MNHCVITAVFDLPREESIRAQGKIWASSLLRQGWDGDIVLIKNFATPIFASRRAGLTEIRIEEEKLSLAESTRTLSRLGRNYAFEIAGNLHEIDGWVIFSDIDTILLRNISHLLPTKGDILISRDNGEIDLGFFAVKAKVVREFSLTALTTGLLSALKCNNWNIIEFEKGEILYAARARLKDTLDPAIIRLSTLPNNHKSRLAFAFHVMSTYWTTGGLLIDILEA